MSHIREVLATNEDVTFVQSENSDIYYRVNYISRLDGSTILLSNWKFENSSGAIKSDESFNDTTTKVKLKGNTGYHLITNKITLDTSEVIEFQFSLCIKINNVINRYEYWGHQGYL